MNINADLSILDVIGHLIIWVVLSIITLGLGYIFYVYRVWNYALNNSRVE